MIKDATGSDLRKHAFYPRLHSVWDSGCRLPPPSKASNYCKCVHVKQIGKLYCSSFCFFWGFLSVTSHFLLSFPSSSLRPSSASFPNTLPLDCQAERCCSCTPARLCSSPSVSLCDAISDYIVITNALGAGSQQSLCRTWAKLFREPRLQLWIYMGVKCLWASVAQKYSDLIWT